MSESRISSKESMYVCHELLIGACVSACICGVCVRVDYSDELTVLWCRTHNRIKSRANNNKWSASGGSWLASSEMWTPCKTKKGNWKN